MNAFWSSVLNNLEEERGEKKDGIERRWAGWIRKELENGAWKVEEREKGESEVGSPWERGNEKTRRI